MQGGQTDLACRAHVYKDKSRALKAQIIQELMPAMDHIQRSKKTKGLCACQFTPDTQLLEDPATCTPYTNFSYPACIYKIVMTCKSGMIIHC